MPKANPNSQASRRSLCLILRAVGAFALLGLLLVVLYWWGFHSYPDVAEWVQPGSHEAFIYEGESLYANISTSAFGHLYFTLTCEGESVTSPEIFGDSIDKKIYFPDDAVKRFSGKEVVLQIKLYDADLYSIRFQ